MFLEVRPAPPSSPLTTHTHPLSQIIPSLTPTPSPQAQRQQPRPRSTSPMSPRTPSRRHLPSRPPRRRSHQALPRPTPHQPKRQRSRCPAKSRYWHVEPILSCLARLDPIQTVTTWISYLAPNTHNLHVTVHNTTQTRTNPQIPNISPSHHPTMLTT
jgi:hypothetical protein